jgi:fatty acid CoA ligase FadD21
MTSPDSSILSMLHARASLRPDDIAYTFTDYDGAPDGVRNTLTWSQLARRTVNVAREIRLHGATGDRALILAPQGLDYVLAFLGAMQAGLVAVPLPLPHPGSGLDRVGAVFADTEPAVVLTTSAVADTVGDFVAASRLDTVPKIVEIDALHLDAAEGEPLHLDELPNIAYLQYSSGSTRVPTGVMISHRNLTANFDQLMRGFFADNPLPLDATLVSWLPFYHDMGLVLGVCAPILCGRPAQLTSPVAFLEKPSRWMRALAENPHAWSSAPNFAFDLAARRTTDQDLAGLDLGGVLGIISGAERVDPNTLHRFVDRFAHFNFRDHMMRPAYGLAEATVYVATGTWDEANPAEHFDADELGAGRVLPCAAPRRSTAAHVTSLVRYRVPQSPSVRIVDTDTGRECPPGRVGEIWVHGDNVAQGYWRRPPGEHPTFGAAVVDPSPGTPTEPWLRTGDLGFVHDDGLFIVGRIKDLLIIRGRNHYPEDIETTVAEVTRGRVAAISVPVGGTEDLVVIVEVKESADREAVARDVTAAVAGAHGLSVADLVLVPAGSLPTTTSGKIQRSACAQQYRQQQFTRMDT